MGYLKQFKKHVEENNLSAAIFLWQEYCLSDEVDPKEFISILAAISGTSFANSFSEYIEEGLDLWSGLAESAEKGEVLKYIFDIQTTNSRRLGDIAHTYLNQKYGMIDIFQELLRIVGLRDSEEFRGCIRNFELLIHLQKGNFCFHTGSWGVGEVMDISFLRREVSIEFDFVADIKEISIKNAFKILVPIPKEHFLARRFGDPEKFEAFTRANPIDSIKMLLRDLGDMTAFEIKEEMADLIIPEEEWAKWWSSVRGKLKKDTEIDYPKSIKLPFSLSKTKVTHQGRLKMMITDEKGVSKKIDKIYVFFRDFFSLTKEKEFNLYLRRELAELLLNRSITEVEELQVLFLLEDLNDTSQGSVSELIKKSRNITELVSAVGIVAFKRRLLTEVKSTCEDWVKVFCDLIVANTKHGLRDFLFEEIVATKNEEHFVRRMQRIIDTPADSPLTFIWFFQKVMKNKTELFSEPEELSRLLEGFFILMHHVEVALKDRVLTKKMYSLLIEKRFEIVRRIFKEATVVSLKEMLLLSTKCQILSSHDSQILYALAEVVHPELGKLKKSGDQDDEEEEVIWTTAEGFKSTAERIEQIATKEVIENAKEIEIARAHGDLRENSEYKFAMEKRARLQSEMKTLSKQIKYMRVLTREDIDTSKVSVGTRISMTNPENKTVEYKILGPAEADPDKNILSAGSGLAKDLLNKTIGEKVTIRDTAWTIKEITSFL